MSKTDNALYVEHGYSSREEYLQSLSDEYDVGIDVVLALADVLGPKEDFDGLVNAVEDASNSNSGMDSVIENF